VQGSLGVNQESQPYAIDLLPCEEVVVELTGSASNHPSGNANMRLTIRNAAGQTLAVNNFLCGQSCTTSVPLPNTSPGYPLPGTRGVEGLAKDVIVNAGIFNWFGTPPATYTLTITKQPRQEYNRGGTGFDNAPLIQKGVKQYGSVHPWEPGQFYKIHVGAGESIHARGRFRGPDTLHSSNFTIRVYDSAFVEKKLIVNALAASDWVSFPAPNANPIFYTFTNSGAEGDFYLKLRAGTYVTKDFEFYVTNDPKLTLFLDVDNNFNPSSPDSDDDIFVPGSDPATGLSLPLPAAGSTLIDGNSVKVIAAYTADHGSVVPPPPGVTEAFLLLDQVSRFAGVAMNYGSITDPDFALVDGVVTFGADYTGRTTLEIHDYGGRAIVRGQAGPGPSVATMNLPKDTVGSNWIPDVGWKATANGQVIGTVADGGQAQGIDADATPAGDGTPGDGVVFFEEYRGIVVRNEHRRTDPAVKDLFVYSNLSDILGDQGLGDALNLPVTKHRIFLSEMGPGFTITPSYHNPGYGGDVPGHFPQQALKVIDGGWGPGTKYGEAWVLGPPTPRSLAIEVYDEFIMHASPFTNSRTLPEEYDVPKLRQTLGHEIGHGINIDHNTSVTVMVTGYFPVWDVTNPSTVLPWQAIPHHYDSADVGQIRLR
jgi:hypothetical protein